MPIVRFESTLGGQIFIDVGGLGNPQPVTLGQQYNFNEGQLLIIIAQPNTGYLFAHWRSATTGAYLSDLNPWGWTVPSYNTTIESVFYYEGSQPPPKVHRVNVSISGVGTTDPPEGANYLQEGQHSFTATPATGYVFLHWQTTNNTYVQNPWIVTIVSGFSVTAVFEQIEYCTLTIIAGEGGTTTPMEGVYPIPKRVEYIITAQPYDGYELQHWLLNGAVFQATAPNQLSIVPYGDTATVQPVFKLKAVNGNGGKGCMIAALTVGTSLTPILPMLRQFRDRSLPQRLIQRYYGLSKYVAPKIVQLRGVFNARLLA